MIPDRHDTDLEDMEARFKPWSELEKEPSRFLPWVVVEDQDWDPSLLTDPSRIPDWAKDTDMKVRGQQDKKDILYARCGGLISYPVMWKAGDQDSRMCATALQGAASSGNSKLLQGLSAIFGPLFSANITGDLRESGQIGVMQWVIGKLTIFGMEVPSKDGVAPWNMLGTNTLKGWLHGDGFSVAKMYSRVPVDFSHGLPAMICFNTYGDQLGVEFQLEGYADITGLQKSMYHLRFRRKVPLHLQDPHLEKRIRAQAGLAVPCLCWKYMRVLAAHVGPAHRQGRDS